MALEPAIYAFLERCAPWLIGWVALFALVNAVRIGRHLAAGDDAAAHSSVFAELPGLPLTLLHSVCFAWAVWAMDPWSMALFAWWGPGFLTVVLWLLSLKYRGKRLSWSPLEQVISWACKVNYLGLLIAFVWTQSWGMVFLFSAWIINDQIGMAWLSLDADRLRRTFHDRWIVRLAYPAGLFVPAFIPGFPLRWVALAFGAALFAAWAAGIVRVARRGLLLTVPDDPTLFRNMAYQQGRSSIGYGADPEDDGSLDTPAFMEVPESIRNARV